LVDIDPPNFREARCAEDLPCPPEGGPVECSDTFDPVGSDAVDDGETVGQLFELRARVEDQGNGPLALTSDVLIPHAGVDPDRVDVFLLDAQVLPLLVDIDNDGVCDDINPAIAPTSFPDSFDEAAVAALTALAPEGRAFFDGNIGPINADPEMSDGSCIPALTPDEELPPGICPLTTPATIIIAGADSTEAIYSLPPISDDVCMGNPFDAPASNIADGWACVAVRAEDLLGNLRVSPPVRLCIDADGDGEDAAGAPLAGIGCAPLGGTAAVGNRPSCTDGCTPAESFGDIPSYQVILRFD
jgi:hypothetical protein